MKTKALVQRNYKGNPLPKLLAFCEVTPLDPIGRDGCAIAEMCRALLRAGWEVRIVTLSLGQRDADLASVDSCSAPDPGIVLGWSCGADVPSVPHDEVSSRATDRSKLRPWELRAYIEKASVTLESFRPDIVLTSHPELISPVLAKSQRIGALTTYYLDKSDYIKKINTELQCVDVLIVPSQAMADLCLRSATKPIRVLAEITTSVFDGEKNRLPARIAARTERFVTIINPSPQMGGLFFINIAAQAAVMAPDIKFRAVQARWDRAAWEALDVPQSVLDRIDWYPHTNRMTEVFEQASLMLLPCLHEISPSVVVARSLLAGIPLLAMRTAASEEQIGDAGIFFERPPELTGNNLALPPSDSVLRWVQYIKVLAENDSLYQRAVELALHGSGRFQPDRRAEAAVKLFSLLLEQGSTNASETDLELEALRHHRERLKAELQVINARVDAGDADQMAQSEDTSYLALVKHSLARPAIQAAMAAANGCHWAEARHILEPFLRRVPEDFTALAILAEVAHAEEREGEERQLLHRIVELAPGFVPGQQRLIAHLRRSGDAGAALHHSSTLLARAPENRRYQALHAGLLTAANRFDEAITLYKTCFASYAGTALDWMQYALALKTLGRQSEGIIAYRKAIESAPKHGAAWHGLSNMKLAVFAQADIDDMQRLLATAELTDDDRSNLHFTLGKAYEDARSYQASFAHYAKGNAIRHALNDYDAAQIEDYVASVKETFTKDFFSARAGIGHRAADPIFIVGLHRAGSTLTEQILSSHSQIEGTRELPHMLRIGRDFGGIGQRGLAADLLRDLGPEEWADLGRKYLDLCSSERLTDRMYFIDKMPANWMHTGLIHLILPHAKIIDIRRKPMAAGFALFKMNFGEGVGHSYDQEDIARYYRAYADLMAHFDEVLPGRVHHIQYETLVEDTEAEIRRLIDYCGLPFEEGCLRYWETERAIQTPSSEQVRQPIFKGAVDQWTHYAEWLSPMRAAFGDLIATDSGGPGQPALIEAGE